MANTKDQLDELTEKYWGKYEDNKDNKLNILECYIEKLLPEETNYYEVNKKTKFKHECDEPVDCLVLLVGHSFEPLLQSIYFYQPKTIIPVISKSYGENTSGEDVYDLLNGSIDSLKKNEEMKNGELSLESSKSIEYLESQPEAVFQYLVNKLIPLIKDKKHIIIDITGAKKSMVAGAYLFGAYADITITYVDFEKYSEKYGRPYGYTMIIRELKNPYKIFSLNRWKRVENFYSKNSFKAAEEEIKEIFPSMRETKFFTCTQIFAVEKLNDVLEMLVLWENGEYFAANNNLKKLKEKISNIEEYAPSAIGALSEIWPSAEKGRKFKFIDQVKDLEKGSQEGVPLYLSKKEFLNYTSDELAKIKRLLYDHNDYRSAFQRAGGLNDTLFKARLVILWYKDHLSVKKEEKKDREIKECYVNRSSIDEDKKCLFDTKLIKSFQTFVISDIVTKRKGKIKIEDGETYYIMPKSESSAPIIKGFDKYRKFFSEFRDMRNKAVHFALFPPDEMIKDTLKFIEYDYKEFLDNWAGLLGGQEVVLKTEPPGWDELCQICGIDFLPNKKGEVE